VIDDIIAGIRKVRTHKGASRIAICKYLKAEHELDNKATISAALKKAVSSGQLSQVFAAPCNNCLCARDGVGGCLRTLRVSRVQKGVNRKVVSRPRIVACDRTKRW
jgi:hypothetical protein